MKQRLDELKVFLAEQIINKAFVKMVDETGYDVVLTYNKSVAELGCGRIGICGDL